jgi:Queuosine salvage protein
MLARMQQLRDACAEVAARAVHVRLRTGAIPTYAAGLPAGALPAEPGDRPAVEGREQLAAYWLTLDAINFGSGWFPTLRKRAGRSGYNTIAAAWRERWERGRPYTATQLARLDAAELAAILGQDPAHELMSLFAVSLRDLGAQLTAHHGGSFTALVDGAGGSAVGLAARLGDWECFADRSRYGPIELPFLKRAQIAAADLHRAGVASFGDVGKLTMFADNLVPHVLRLDGVLQFAPALVEWIERERLIAHGSPEEVEIRACAVHAVELLAAARADLDAPTIDQLLWHRGQQPLYKAVPRHRSRCTAY